MNEIKYCQDLFSVLEQKMSETGRKFQDFRKLFSLRNKSHITYSSYMSTSMYLAFVHSHVCIKMHIRRQYSFILPAERQHSQMPVETNWDLSPASTSLSVTSLQLTLKNSPQLSFPSLLICKMELLIPLSLAKCIC